MKKIAIAKVALVVATLVPAAVLGVGIFTTAPIASYGRYVINTTGDWGLRLLVITLCITPIRRLTGWHDVIQLRRTLGIAAFCYSAVHVLLWAELDWFFQLRPILEHIVSDPFYATGTVAFVLLIPLTITSNRAAMTRLGRRWQQVHWLTYVAIAAALAHYWLSGPFAALRARKWIAIVTILLGFRLLWSQRATAFPLLQKR